MSVWVKLSKVKGCVVGRCATLQSIEEKDVVGGKVKEVGERRVTCSRN